MKKMRKIYGLLFLVTFIWLVSSTVLAQDCTATIQPSGPSYPSIQAAINSLGPNALYRTINVTGTCNENVTITPDKNGITLNGGGTATIIGLYPNQQATIVVLGKQATIRGLYITGGIDGIQLVQGGNATIRNNYIYGNNRFGILLVFGSYGGIIYNEIYNNGVNTALPSRAGIGVSDNSVAYIGYLSPNDTSPSPNLIYENPVGILVSGSSAVRIVGNTINNNTGDGINVSRVSSAVISKNTIDANGQNGIFVTHNSGVNLGMNTGNTNLDLPNISTVPNGDKGLRCSIGGYADGALGSLNGAGKHGAIDFTKDCINNLIP